MLRGDDVYVSDGALQNIAHAMAREPLDAVFGDVVFFDRKRPSRDTHRYRSRHFRPARVGWGWMLAQPALLGVDPAVSSGSCTTHGD